MKLPGKRLLARFGRWTRNRVRGGGSRRRVLVLGYHRVADVDDDPMRLAVSPRHFAEHVEVIARRGLGLRLGALAAPSTVEGRREAAVAITFDDGYLDNLESALPILEKHGVPATVFVTTGCLGGRFWWSELDRLPSGSGKSPVSMSFRIGGREEEIRYDPADREARSRAYLRLARLLRSASAAERDAVGERLRSLDGGEAPDPLSRVMTAQELNRLVEGGVVELGAHTVSHPRLAELDEASQRLEIEDSRAELASITSRPPESFAYPHGSFGDPTPSIVREAGFSLACTTVPDVFWPGRDPFRIPRFFVPDAGGEMIESLLRRWG